MEHSTDTSQKHRDKLAAQRSGQDGPGHDGSGQGTGQVRTGAGRPRADRKAPVPLPLHMRPRTASVIIQDDLRREIVSLRRKPGEVISEKEIAARYGVSRTPVREAMLRLGEERLVETVPQSGTYVTRIPVDLLDEAILVRRALERETARLAAERCSEADLQAIEAIVTRQIRAVDENDRDAFHEADEAFHEAIAVAAGYPGVWRIVQSARFQVDRYRRLTLPVPGRMARVIEEHRLVLEAIRSGAPAEASRYMEEHLTALQTFADLDHINPDYLLRSAKRSGKES